MLEKTFFKIILLRFLSKNFLYSRTPSFFIITLFSDILLLFYILIPTERLLNKERSEIDILPSEFKSAAFLESLFNAIIPTK